MLRARVSDPAGPRRWRTATTLGPLLLGVLALPFDFTTAASLTSLAIAWMFAGAVLRPRLRSRQATVAVERRAIRISGAGVVSQRIAASDVVAATTSRVEGGVRLTLARSWLGDSPLELEVAGEQDAERLRRALGIPARGFGTVYTQVRDLTWWITTVLRLLSAAGWVMIAFATALGAIEVALGLTAVMLLLAWVTFVWAFGAGARISEVAPTSPQDAHYEAQDRAGVAPLARRDAEDCRAWLQRIDAMAAAFDESGGYRGGGVESADLWRALEDPDAPPALRAAAARMLARIAPDEASVRIGDALAVERDGATRARIRVALEEDVETAARGLERLSR